MTALADASLCHKCERPWEVAVESPVGAINRLALAIRLLFLLAREGPMKSLAFALCVCALVASGSASAGQTCKAKANQQKLVGEALVRFVKQCESDTLMVCANLAAGKPDSDAFMDACAVKALGVGPRWCNPDHCKTSSDCTGGAGCGVCWAGLCGK